MAEFIAQARKAASAAVTVTAPSQVLRCLNRRSKRPTPAASSPTRTTRRRRRGPWSQLDNA